MAENKYDLLVEDSGGSLIPTEELRLNLFQDAYQFDSINSSRQPGLNDATNINGVIRWFNEQYSKLGGGMGNLYPDLNNNEPKIKRMDVADYK